MCKIEFLAIQFDKTRFTVYYHSTLFLKVIETPHIMISGKEMHLYSPIG